MSAARRGLAQCLSVRFTVFATNSGVLVGLRTQIRNVSKSYGGAEMNLKYGNPVAEVTKESNMRLRARELVSNLYELSIQAEGIRFSLLGPKTDGEGDEKTTAFDSMEWDIERCHGWAERLDETLRVIREKLGE
jgi:hypothetical protein